MAEDERRRLAAEEATKTEVVGASATHDEEPAEETAQSVERRSSPWRRLSIITFILLLLWLAWAVHKHNNRPKVLYADRYSDEYRYRPAASPVITEILKDGRTRLRGALPTDL